jgi:hypothetical protein
MESTSILIRRTFPIVLLAPLLSGCEAIGAIFKAGVWVGAIAVVIALALVVFIVAKVRGS